jgi:hypothetical protein
VYVAVHDGGAKTPLVQVCPPLAQVFPLGGNNNSLYFPPQLPTPGTTSTTADQNDLFCLELKYDNPLATYEIPAQAQKNGNISQLWWRVRGRSAEAWGLEYDYPLVQVYRWNKSHDLFRLSPLVQVYRWNKS